VKPERSEAEQRAYMNQLWQAGRPVRSDDPVGRWLQRRGIRLSAYPICLRSHPGLRHSGPPVTTNPGMLAMVSAPTGKPAMLHRTFLTPDGKKAPVDKVRMFCAGKVPTGSAVRLAPSAPFMGVAEGVETSLAAAQMFGVPTWAALCDRGVEKFEPPTAVEHLIIFGDNDANGAGQRAAYALAARLSSRTRIEVRIPDQPDTDWNDVLLDAGV
jgi:putative DNA primase/helicase